MRSYQRHPADFQSVVPGICSFLAKGFNLEFDAKSSYLAELCELIEVFVELFCDFYRQDIINWNIEAASESQKKQILASFSGDLESYNKIKHSFTRTSEQSALSSVQQPEMIIRSNTVSKVLEKLFHCFHNQSTNPKHICGKNSKF